MKKPVWLAFFLFLSVLGSQTSASPADTLLQVIYTSGLKNEILQSSPEHKSGITSLLDSLKHAIKAPSIVANTGNLSHSSDWAIYGDLGYDVIMPGFDALYNGTAAFAEKLRRVHSGSRIPPKILLTNLDLTSAEHDPHPLQNLYDEKLVHEYVILERGGYKIGIFAVVGNEVVFKLQHHPDFRFKDPELSAQQASRFLKYHEQVDIIVCLTFSGMSKKGGSHKWTGETQYLGQKAPDIDIIISGGTNSVRTDTLYSEKTPVLQAAANQPVLNTAEISINNEVRGMHNLQQTEIAIPTMQKSSPQIAESTFKLDNTLPNSRLGNFLSDAILWRAHQATSVNIDFAFLLNENIRSGWKPAENSSLTQQDIDALMPPIDFFKTRNSGLPLVHIYIDGSTLQKLLEINSSVYPLKGPNYFLHFAGLKAQYNTSRILFNRVTGAVRNTSTQLSGPISFAADQLYSVVFDWITAQRLLVMHRMTSGFLKMDFLDKNGEPVEDLKKFLLNANKNHISFQQAITDYCATFSDMNGNGLADIPQKYESVQNRIEVQSSMNLHNFMQNPSFVMIVLIVISLLMLIGVIAVIVILVRRIRA